MSEIAVRNTGTTTLIDGYTSITGDDVETRKRVFKAVSDAVPLKQALGKTLTIVDVIVQPTSSENEQTGEVEEYLRTTLIDDKGVAHSAGSVGIATALKNIFDIVGEPGSEAWPLKVKPVSRTGRKGFDYLTLELV